MKQRASEEIAGGGTGGTNGKRLVLNAGSANMPNLQNHPYARQ